MEINIEHAKPTSNLRSTYKPHIVNTPKSNILRELFNQRSNLRNTGHGNHSIWTSHL